MVCCRTEANIHLQAVPSKIFTAVNSLSTINLDMRAQENDVKWIGKGLEFKKHIPRYNVPYIKKVHVIVMNMAMFWRFGSKNY